MEITPPIHLVPNELLIQIIDKLPRTQWPSLELVDRKFRDAVFYAWGSIRTVDMERDFMHSELAAIKDEDDHDFETVKQRLHCQIARETETILKKLSERSPLITSLRGLSRMADDPSLNTMAVQYLSEFEHLETIKFAKKCLSGQIDNNGGELRFWSDIPLINFVEFVESTRSRATLKVISIDQCPIPNDSIMVADDFDRLRAAFANDSDDPTRQLLQLESCSMRTSRVNHPLTLFDNIDASKLTKLCLGRTAIEPIVLRNLIKGAPRLQHIDFAFLVSCSFYDNTPTCQGGRRQPNKELLSALRSHPCLTSLGFNRIWTRDENGCTCQRFVRRFKRMLRKIGPRLVNFVFKPGFIPPDLRMGKISRIIERRMPNLKSITLDACCAADPEELRGIADGKELEEIEITTFSNSSNNNNYKRILNDVLSTILRKSPGLKRFNGVDYYPDHGVAIELCKLNDLIELRIRADRLSEENFIAFSQQVFAQRLQVLHVGQIEEGVESGLIELIGNAHQLRELAVDGNVTDELLECLADSCPSLEKFRVELAVGITFNGIQMLVDRCPNLRCLHVENIDYTLASSLKDLKLDRYRNLELN